MRLRSLTKHIREQNWFAVALDFFIVVVGILIAFQITSWSEARSDNSRIERRLANVVDDLRADIVEIEGIIKTTEWRASAIQTVLDSADKPITPRYQTPFGDVIETPKFPAFESEFPWDAANAIVWLATLDGNRGGYQTLLSTGDLQLIKSETLSRKIQAYYARAEEISDTDKAHQDVRDQVTAVRQRLGVGINQTTTDELVKLVREDREFSAALSHLFGQDTVQIVIMLEASANAEELIAAIEKELE